MPKTTNELPDVDVETLNAMIADLGREMGCPPAGTVYPPDLVELGEIPGHIYGYNRGCRPDGLEMYREGQRWRRKIIAELKARPEWAAQWLAAAELDRRIEALCERMGLHFAPHEMPPWMAPDEASGSLDGTEFYRSSLPEAVRLRRQLIRELEAEAALRDRGEH
jgi:hypothetical protein